MSTSPTSPAAQAASTSSAVSANGSAAPSNATQATTAAESTFAVPELLEMILILMEAGPEAIINALQVDRTFKAAVNGSTALKKALFLVSQGTKTAPPAGATSAWWNALDEDVSLNPLLGPDLYNYDLGGFLTFEISEAVGLDFVVDLDFDRVPGHGRWMVEFKDESFDDFDINNDEQDPNRFTVNNTASYTKMYATAPACAAELAVYWPMTYDEKVCLTRPGLTDSLGGERTTFQAKVMLAPATVGEVLRTVKAIIDNRPEVDDWEEKYPEEEAEEEDEDGSRYVTWNSEAWKMEQEYDGFPAEAKALMTGALEYKILNPLS